MSWSGRKCLFALLGLICLSFANFPAGPAFSASNAGNVPELAVEKQSPEYIWVLRTPGKAGVVQVILTLRDAAGKTVKGRRVTGEVLMPTMPMPGYPLELEFQEAEDGKYAALVQYGHGGYWQIKARFKDDKDQLFQQVFDLDIKD
ncbi:MAG: FixH family protein [Desulfovibrio sp.]|jgi:nitrogen fixation protein FixH|nr:FixH family protein [Desulfovibrio sp.]